MKRVLIDTDILIDFLRKSEEAKKLIVAIINEDILGLISVITEAELFSGSECSDPGKRKAVEELLLLMNKVEVDSDIAKKAGEFRREYHTPLLDSLIAATAVTLKAVLCTRNTKHFRQIKELKISVPY